MSAPNVLAKRYLSLCRVLRTNEWIASSRPAVLKSERISSKSADAAE